MNTSQSERCYKDILYWRIYVSSGTTINLLNKENIMKLLTVKQAIKFQPRKGRNPHNYQFHSDRFQRSLVGSNVLARHKPNLFRTLLLLVVRTINWHLK